MHRQAVLFCALVGVHLLGSILLEQAMAAEPAGEWQTRAEATNYRRTSRYDEDIAYAQRLAAASPLVQLQLLGKSPEGRAIPVLVVSKDKAFTPEAARATGKDIVLVNAAIHPGEIPGKDAGFAFVRDLVISGKHAALLDGAILVFIPVFGVDGHERFGPYTRINQNGPEESGWRTTAQNLNLNRDFLKADTPEMRVWLNVFERYLPDLIVDTHDTDGADYQYNLTYGLETGASLDPALVAWQKVAFEGEIFPAVAGRGHVVSPYIILRDSKDVSKGITQDPSEPRFSTGYGALQNRPTLLVETHMLKDYKSRVTATYDLLVEIFAHLKRYPSELRTLVARVDEQTVARGRRYDPNFRYPLTFKLSEHSRPFQFQGFETTLELSAVSGSTWLRYEPTKPKTFTIPLFDEATVEKAVAPPLAYVVPVSLTEVIDKIKAHGLRHRTLDGPSTLTVETYEFSAPVWEAAPFEGRIRLKDFKLTPIRRQITYPAGSLVVPLDQRAANVAIHLLEPQGPDSLLQWGFLDAIFEQKEYAEAYVMEKMAREMLARDPKLKAEFERKVSEESAFAASPEARLEFFYRRTPYWDDRYNIYPIGRLTAPENLPK
ncbi:M14 family metallopeptidase [Gloeobacter violaceus]|uniref:Gll2474 protein n=1 Tax=Gloeobacter violaceus (strain ATCC 29082 / PCC 7421) TaxID=251221 RepID=Q7NHR1_GLOVI|nr:M14 family metallopeptidase [Gloeobacter violaceus]BAC90415.1 gll2474 [Gloeobacter violaceus PCC 7421]